MLDRRAALRGVGGALALAAPGLLPRPARAAAGALLPPGLPQGLYGAAVLGALPGKVPLIKLSYRPPNYETPIAYFDRVFTPNDAFFVRYHLAGIPDRLDADAWKVRIGGEAVATPLELSLADLKGGFEQVELAAVCQCSGNRRGFSDPHVPGVQWGPGAMGNALWRGVRLKDVLAKAGLRKEALVVVVNGADGPVLDATPDFVKSLPLWKALDENTLIAHTMNGEPLPRLNGFPVRLIVPGWASTYWMKHLDSVEVTTRPFDGFFVKTAYRVPKGKFPLVDRFVEQEDATSTPDTELVVNSLITAPTDGAEVRTGQPVEVRGVAWDGGYGIVSVLVSGDGGESWREAALGQDHGRFSFRPWSLTLRFDGPGRRTVLAKATNAVGQTQTRSLVFNASGYCNNVPLPVTVAVS